jgi:acyl carrier protein
MTQPLDATIVEAIILRALEDLNEELAPEDLIDVSPTTALFGPDARLDSLSLVSVIVDVETALGLFHGLTISLVDDRALSRDVAPYRDVQTLTAYVLELAVEPAHR